VRDFSNAAGEREMALKCGSLPRDAGDLEGLVTWFHCLQTWMFCLQTQETVVLQHWWELQASSSWVVRLRSQVRERLPLRSGRAWHDVVDTVQQAASRNWSVWHVLYATYYIVCSWVWSCVNSVRSQSCARLLKAEVAFVSKSAVSWRF